MPRQYPPEFKERAVRLVDEALPDHATEFEAIRKVADRLGISTEALRRWRRQCEIDTGVRPGATSIEHAEIKWLKCENAELRRAGGTEREFITSAAIAPPRPGRPRIVPCATRSSSRTSAGFMRRTTRSMGSRKMHAAMSRAGWLVCRDQVARLMRSARIRGISRGPTRVTTTPASRAAGRFPDLVNRQFTAAAPNRLWVADITYLATWSGFAYVAFVTDACTHKIVDWNVSSRLTTEMLPLHALEMAAWVANETSQDWSITAITAVQYLSIRYSDRLADLGVLPSTGSVGDSYDNALAESVNELFKTELIKPRKPWRTVEEIELATTEWVSWFNNTRLHSELGYRTPNEVEASHYPSGQHARPSAGSLANARNQTQSGSTSPSWKTPPQGEPSRTREPAATLHM